MAFITEKEELKPGLIVFRRGDVDHRMWYCRMKMPKADRYKTVSLKTTDLSVAKEKAFDQDADVRFRIKHDVPVFNHPFREVAHEYLLTQEARAKRGEISTARPKKLRAVIEGTLDRYAGSTQVHLIGDERWGSYPAWRRENGAGRHHRNGVREVTAAVAQTFAEYESSRRTKVQHTKGVRVLKPIAVEPQGLQTVPFISDSTIRFEMSIFGAIMNYAVKKRYVPASQRFDERPKLKTMRRDEFTLEEYRKLHVVGRKWIAEADKPSSVWYRTVTYNLILIACNTGMRPAEMKNLRWRDIMPAKDREGREIVVLFVQGKGKSRKLVAPKSVGDYLERVRAISKATAPDTKVFTTITGQSAKTLYSSLIADLLTQANLREGMQGVPRSTYCFRHTYATLRLQEGVDVYFLAEQMGTSVHMIESHYGHAEGEIAQVFPSGSLSLGKQAGELNVHLAKVPLRMLPTIRLLRDLETIRDSDDSTVLLVVPEPLSRFLAVAVDSDFQTRRKRKAFSLKALKALQDARAQLGLIGEMFARTSGLMGRVGRCG